MSIIMLKNHLKRYIITKVIKMDKKEYGLVLSGGGTRGAFQLGVWNALQEMNI